MPSSLTLIEEEETSCWMVTGESSDEEPNGFESLVISDMFEAELLERTYWFSKQSAAQSKCLEVEVPLTNVCIPLVKKIEMSSSRVRKQKWYSQGILPKNIDPLS